MCTCKKYRVIVIFCVFTVRVEPYQGEGTLDYASWLPPESESSAMQQICILTTCYFRPKRRRKDSIE